MDLPQGAERGVATPVRLGASAVKMPPVVEGSSGEAKTNGRGDVARRAHGRILQESIEGLPGCAELGVVGRVRYLDDDARIRGGLSGPGDLDMPVAVRLLFPHATHPTGDGVSLELVALARRAPGGEVLLQAERGPLEDVGDSDLLRSQVGLVQARLRGPAEVVLAAAGRVVRSLRFGERERADLRRNRTPEVSTMDPVRLRLFRFHIEEAVRTCFL